MMKLVQEDTYLGDIVRSDGKNSSNIKSRVSKGLGIIAQIMTILETVSFGASYFEIALSLREAKFQNGILTNADVWYNLGQNDLEELETVDRLLLRRILSVPETTCIEALYLETGSMDIDTIIKAKRINYLHYLIKEEGSTMLFKFFKVQWDRPAKGDWTTQVKKDLEDFDIPGCLEYLEGISVNSFKSLVKKKSVEYALEKFQNKKIKHSKLDNLTYSDLKIQEYLKSSNIPPEDCKLVMQWRFHMARFGANYGQPTKKCPLCEEHDDSQEDSFNTCPVIKQKVGNHSIKYHEIFNQPNNEIIKVLKQVRKAREYEADG